MDIVSALLGFALGAVVTGGAAFIFWPETQAVEQRISNLEQYIASIEKAAEAKVSEIRKVL